MVAAYAVSGPGWPLSRPIWTCFAEARGCRRRPGSRDKPAARCAPSWSAFPISMRSASQLRTTPSPKARQRPWRAVLMATGRLAFSPMSRPARGPAKSGGRGGALGLSPAVSEGLVVIDLGKGGVDGSELVSDPLDARADIRSVAIFAAPRDETDVMHTIVDRPICHVAADVRGQQVHDLEFGERQMNIGIVPEGTADPRLQHQTAAMEIVHQVGFAGLLHRIGDQP